MNKGLGFVIKLERMSTIIPDISIVCITYNQADLVAQALDGFINQELDCVYEIIIHDDASTDNTPEVLKCFYDKYPDKVTLLLQTENQNSKPDVDVTCCGISHAKGRYIALCEGDDYWIDTRKLQKQYQILEGDHSISASFHSAYTETPNGDRKTFALHCDVFKKYTTEEVILGDGSFMPTSSLFFRKSTFNKINKELIESMPCGDYFFQIIASSEGGAAYLNKPMSIYRIGHAGSFTTNFSSSDWNKKAKFYQRMKCAIDIVNTITSLEYNNEFREMKLKFNKIYRKCIRRSIKSKIRKIIFNS